MSSMGIVAGKDNKNGPHHDGEVEPDTPVVDVPNIELDPSLHLIEGVRLAAGAVNLCPTRYTGLYVVAERIFLDNRCEMPFVRRRVGPRPDQRHVTQEHVEQLGELVNAVSTQPPADPRHPLVALLRLLNDVAIFHHRHGAKLVDPERPPIKTMPGLPKKRRAMSVQPDRDRGSEQDRRQDNQSE